MAKPRLGHAFLVLAYSLIGSYLLVVLSLFFWKTIALGILYPYQPPLVSPISRVLPEPQAAEFLAGATSLPARNIWSPQEDLILSKLSPGPTIMAEAYLSVDLDSGGIILAKNHHQRRPVASLVKVMTALVALERAEPDKVLVVSPQAATTGEDSMNLKTGEQLTLTELLYGLILVSGNDAAETIAAGVAGKGEVFVDWMNLKADELGLIDTYFANSSGLMTKDDETGSYRADEYSTPYDLAVISYAFLEKPLLKKIAATPEFFIPATKTHLSHQLYSQTNLLTTDVRVKGLKMGYTPASGLDGVTYAEAGSHHVLGVVLNTPNRRHDLENLIEYSFCSLGSGSCIFD